MKIKLKKLWKYAITEQQQMLWQCEYDYETMTADTDKLTTKTLTLWYEYGTDTSESDSVHT